MGKQVLVYSKATTDKILKYEPRVETFTDYADMQKFVGGYIELVPIPIIIDNQHYDVFINEEGKFVEGLLPSMTLLHNGEIHDLVIGDFFVSKSNEEGESVSLSDDEIEKIKQYVEENSGFFLITGIGEAKLLKLSFS